MLRYSSGVAELRQFLPVMHPLWGSDYSAIGHPANITYRVQQKAHSNAQGMGGLGTQRDGVAGLGERQNGDWPGAIYGVRAPDPAETPLSWAEVHVLREALK
tara:strand:- start:1847 stop:2152 length:306 start_codon:yes stop_codon:yes gene_type:complete